MYREQLEYFALAYRLGSFSAAAKRVPMSPQGLAKSVRSLEGELGVTLFEAGANGEIAPTEYADELLRFVNRFEAGLSSAKEAFRRIRAAENREVRVDVALGILGYLGPDFVKGFERRRPGVALRYDEVDDVRCDEDLRRGECGLALGVAPYPGEFAAAELYSTPMCFWVSAADELAGKAELSVEDLRRRDVAIPGAGFKCFRYLLERCGDAGVELGGLYTSAEIFRLFEFARQGRGLGFSARHLVEMPLFKGDPGVVGIPLEGASWRFGLCRLASHRPSDAERAFIGYCLESVGARG